MSSEPENLNDFDATDCGLATLMLGVVPAIIHFVFCGGTETLVTTGLMGVAGVLLAVGVWGLAVITHSRLVGMFVNWAGCILTPLYIAVTVYLWAYADDAPPAEPAAEAVETPQE
ncbi:MAG: hypothetical protein Q4C88_03510 [Akkermansia sp.]|nr:hypothetical protein [Akkermansia sp.]